MKRVNVLSGKQDNISKSDELAQNKIPKTREHISFSQEKQNNWTEVSLLFFFYVIKHCKQVDYVANTFIHMWLWPNGWSKLWAAWAGLKNIVDASPGGNNNIARLFRQSMTCTGAMNCGDPVLLGNLKCYLDNCLTSKIETVMSKKAHTSIN